MSLYDEKLEEKNREKRLKAKKIVIFGIIISIVLIIALMIIIYYLIYNPNKITVKVDGRESEKIANILIKEISPSDDSIIIYAPIRDLASIWGYDSFKGEYETNFEDDNSCYIQSSNQVVVFNANSNIIYKTDIEQAKKQNGGFDYEQVEIENIVIKKNDKLYLSLDGIRKAFNVIINDYNDKTKKIEITTLASLSSRATSLATKAGYKEIDSRLVNTRALLNNLVVVVRPDGQKGVIGLWGETSGKEIIGAQYDDITYIPQKNLFVVKKLNKVGIRDEKGERKISETYDDLVLIDSQNNLYMAKKNNHYGVIDINENTILYIQYDQIGVDIRNYSQNRVKNGYLLLGKLIPVRQSYSWGFFSIEKDENGKVNAKQITNLSFNQIGCETKVNKGLVSNIMVMEDYDIIVVKQRDYYGLMYSDGSVAIPTVLSDLYMETADGKTNYYMVSKDGKTFNMIEYFENNSIKKVK